MTSGFGTSTLRNWLNQQGWLRRRSHELPLYFLHVPRTAGTSVSEQLDNEFSPKEVFPGKLPHTLFDVTLDQLAHYRFFRGHFGVLIPNLLGWRLRTFTLVRDPVAQILSAISFTRGNPWHPLFQRFVNTGMSVSDQLRDPVFQFTVGNLQAMWLTWDPGPDGPSRKAPPKLEDPDGWKSYALAWKAETEALLPLDDNALLTRATAVLDRIDVVGVTERVDEAMGLLYGIMGWSDRVSLPVRNVARSPIDPSSLNSSDLRYIRDRRAVDFELHALATRRLDAALAASG